MIRNDVLKMIIDERIRQDEKWGTDRDLDWLLWLGILVEEVGETAQAILQHQGLERVCEELVQVVAVGIVWLENMQRNK